MRQKTDIEKVKTMIRNYIIGKNMIAVKFAYRGEIIVAQNAIILYETGELDKSACDTYRKVFGISSEKFRDFDKAIRVDGKKKWLSQIVIEEMKNEGKLSKVKNSYKAGGFNSFSKTYALDAEYIEELFYKDKWRELSSKNYDDCRQYLEKIDVRLNIYQHDKGHVSEMY